MTTMVRPNSRFSLIARTVGVALLLVAIAGAALGVYWFRQPTRELHLPGTVETQEVRLSSRVGGRVSKVLVSESQLVEPGQEIVELEMPELDAQRNRLVAERAAAEAALERLNNLARPEEL